MKNPDPWQRLTQLSRPALAAAPLPRDVEEDSRFAARIVRQHFRATTASSPRITPSWGLPWETWSLRGMMAAGAMATVMLAWNFTLLSPDSPPDDVIPPDSVAELAAAF